MCVCLVFLTSVNLNCTSTRITFTLVSYSVYAPFIELLQFTRALIVVPFSISYLFFMFVAIDHHDC